MAGFVIPRTPIAVDCWRRRNNPQAKLFFLSHMHSDHTVGLNSSWNQTIYCSEITKALAIEKFDIAPSLMVAIPIGQSTILDLDEIGVEKLTVTLIDANHCPGAVMFLFQGYFGQILCTGDFRYVEGMLDVAPLKTNATINTLYLDNTYCKLDCEFPPRADAILMILNIVQKHLNKNIVFGLDTLGKEDLLFKVAMVLEVPIVVDEYRLKTTKLLGYNVGFTTDPNASNIRVVPRNQVNQYTVSLWNKEHPTVAILPTCRFMGLQNPYAVSENILVVSYSDHSSFSELKQFVATLKPQRIIPIVRGPRNPQSGSREDMSIFNQDKFPDTTPHVFNIPASVLNFMSQSWNVAIVPSHQGKKRKPLSFFTSRSKRPCGVVFPSHKNRPTMIEGGSRKKCVVSVPKSNEAENSDGSIRKTASNEGADTVEGGECEAMSRDRVQTDNPNESAKNVQEQFHAVENHDSQNYYSMAEETIHPKNLDYEKESIHDRRNKAGNNAHAMETNNAENEAGGVKAATPSPEKLCAMETSSVCEGHNATEEIIFTETCNIMVSALVVGKLEPQNERQVMGMIISLGEVEGGQQEQIKDDGDERAGHCKPKQDVGLETQDYQEPVSKFPFDPDETFEEGYCECEDTVPKNLVEMHVPKVQVKIEPEEEDCIAETNWAQREYGVAEEAVPGNLCHGSDQEPSVKNGGNSTKAQCGLAEAFDTSFCYPKNVFLYEGKWERTFKNDKDQELNEKDEGNSTESQHGVAEVAANLSHSKNVFHYKEKHTDVFENNRKEIQDDHTEMFMLSEQHEEMLSAETNETCDTTPPKEHDNLKMTLEEDYPPERYCIGQTKRRHSNIYGGSCTFAWNVVKKLKARHHSK